MVTSCVSVVDVQSTWTCSTNVSESMQLDTEDRRENVWGEAIVGVIGLCCHQEGHRMYLQGVRQALSDDKRLSSQKVAKNKNKNRIEQVN